MNKTHHITIDNLRTKSEAQFELFYHLYYVRLVKYAQSFLFDQKDAEDVVQNLFIYFWENIQSIEPKGSLDAYLLTAVKNRCLNKLKSLNIRDKHNLLFVESYFSNQDCAELFDEEITCYLRNALDKLPTQTRTIIDLKYNQGKKIAEIADILDISPNTVKTLLLRGKSRLKKELVSQSIVSLAITFCKII